MRKVLCRRMLAATALVGVFAYGCAEQPTVDQGGSLVSEEGRIAFTRVSNFGTSGLKKSDIYAIDVDSSREMRLTDSPGFDGFPAWSLDGERIAFASSRDGNWEIYVMDSDGAHQRRLTRTPKDEGVPAFSPDGEKIAYVTDPIDNPQIHLMNADGTGREWLADGNWPTWSPDGKRIAITVYPGGAEQLAAIDADGTDEHRLTGRFLPTGPNSEAAWSPDGKRIAFVSGKNDEDIYAINSDGSKRTRLTDEEPGNDHWPPTWSPDSSRIAFTSDGPGRGDIYVMNSDGSGLTKLTEDPAYDAFPAWRP
jgi:Tol biopolymer transport system component